MISSFVGPSVGPQVAPILQLGGALSGVTRDATSGIYCPSSAAQCQAVLTAAGISAPSGASALWLLQEAAGNPADSIGSFALTASGVPSYQQAVSGWARKAISFPDGSGGALSSVSAALPDISTTSFAVLAYVQFPSAAPAGARNLVSLGAVAATRSAAEIVNTGPERAFCNGNTANGTSLNTGAVHPVLVMVDRTHSVMAVSTDQDDLVPTFSTGTTGKGITFGATTNFAAAVGYLWGMGLVVQAAELSKTQRRSLLQTVGFSPVW